MGDHFVRARGFVCAALLASGLVPACGKPDDAGLIGTVRRPLTAQCIQLDAGVLPSGAWLCPDPRGIECTANQANVPDEVIYVEPPSPATCSDLSLRVDPGPFPVGTHEVVVRDVLADGGAREICGAELTVVDTTLPVVRTRDLSLWPPDHEMRDVSVEDCITVEDACDPLPSARFIWATSDEAADARGDGSTAPDVSFTGCKTVQLRQERSGNGDGRVYRLGFRVTDASGNAVEGVCRVLVPHDQGGHAAEQGSVAYQLTAPPCSP